MGALPKFRALLLRAGCFGVPKPSQQEPQRPARLEKVGCQFLPFPEQAVRLGFRA